MDFIMDITTTIIEILKKNPQGLGISEIVRLAGIRRNVASRTLHNLLNSGQIEMHRSGKVKIYTISDRVPVSSKLSISSEYVIQLDNNLNIIYASRPLSDLLGISQEDLLEKNIEFSGVLSVFENNVSDLLFRLRSALSGIEWKGEQVCSKRGIVFSCRIVPTIFVDGRKGVTFLFNDITGKKRSKDLLRVSERLLSHLIENLPCMAFRCRNDLQMTMEYVSNGCYQLTGYDPSSFSGNSAVSFADLIHPTDRDTVSACLKESTAWNKPFNVTFRIHPKEGSEKSVYMQGTCIARSEKEAEILEGFITEMSVGKPVDETLLESEETFRTLFTNTNDMITLYEINPDGLPGRFIAVNEEVCRQLKFSRQELLSMLPKDIVPPQEWTSFTTHAERVREDRYGTFETVHNTKEGIGIPVEISAHLFDLGGKAVVLSVIRDISDRKKTDTSFRRDEPQKTDHIEDETATSDTDRVCGTSVAVFEARDFGSMIERALLSRGYAIERENTEDSGNYSLTIPLLQAIKESAGYTVRIGVAWQESRSAANVSVIRVFSSSLQHSGIEQGIYASLGGFTAEAIAEAEQRSVDLWDMTDVLGQDGGSEHQPSAESFVTFPLAAGYRELFSPCLLNHKRVIMTSATLRYIPFMVCRSGQHSKASDQNAGLQHPDDTLTFLVNMLTAEVVTAVDQGTGWQHGALMEQFARTNPTPVKIPLADGYTVSVARAELSQTQVQDTIRKWYGSPAGKNPSVVDQTDPVIGEQYSLEKDASLLSEVFIPRWDIEFQAGPRIYRRVAYAGTLTTITDSIMHCAACDQETRPSHAAYPAIAVCEECWRPFCKEHIIKCAICETYLCKDHIRTCLSCGRHFCAEHATQECDIAERYQRLLELKRIPRASTIRGIGIVLLAVTAALTLWTTFWTEMDPVSAVSSLMLYGGPLAIFILAFSIFGIAFTFLEYRKKSDRSVMIADSVMYHRIAPRSISAEKNADHSSTDAKEH